MTTLIDTITATCNTCGYPGTLRALELHSCAIQEQGGRCEDFPCCGHTDGDGCQTLPSHTSAFYHDNPHLLHEPGSPEWYDALDDMQDDDEPEWFCKGCGGEYPDNTDVFDNGNKVDDHCASCRVRWFIEHAETRTGRQHYANHRRL